MKPLFTEIIDREEVRNLSGNASPFFAVAWERALQESFPYLTFRYFVYRGTHLIRLASVAGRLTTVPFSDGGDVVALARKTLSLATFRADTLSFFGPSALLRVHDSFAPLSDDTKEKADIIDFRIPLPSFSIESVRKTLRHILSRPLPPEHTITQTKELSHMEKIFELYCANMKEARALAMPFETFKHLARQDVFVLMHGSQIRAAAIFIRTSRSAHHFVSVSDAAGKRMDAAHHLLFHALTHYRKEGLRSAFLGGVRTDSPLKVFKEGWRGEPHQLYTIGGGVSRERRRVSPLRSVWGLLPAALLPKATKIIGKRVF